MAIPLKYNIRNLFVRKMTTFATAGGVALVVVVMVLLLSLVTGLERTLFATGSPNNLIVLRKGATSEAASFALREWVQALHYLPGIARTPEDEPLVSPELLAQPLLQRVNGDDAEIGTLRALGFGRGAILASFVSESLCLTLVGYVGGVLLGVGAVTVVNVLTRGIALQLPTFSTAVVVLHISPLIFLMTLGVTIVMGIFGGFFPAYRAARLRVTEALRRA